MRRFCTDLAEKRNAKGLTTHLAFMDLPKAHDRAPQNKWELTNMSKTNKLKAREDGSLFSLPTEILKKTRSE